MMRRGLISAQVRSRLSASPREADDGSAQVNSQQLRVRMSIRDVTFSALAILACVLLAAVIGGMILLHVS